MKLRLARKLRNEIRNAGLHCVVPLGRGPAGYFARIFSVTGPVEFHCRKDWLLYQEQMEQREEASRLEMERQEVLARLPRPRSPIEYLIDKACGLR